MAEEVVERFRPTGGRVVGVLGLALAALAVVIALVDGPGGFGASVVAGAVALGVLTWAAMLRPAVWATSETLVFRNMLEVVRIPLAAVEQVAVRQVLAVRAGEKRYVSSAVGRSLRQTMKAGRRDPGVAPSSYPDFVEDRIAQLADDARARRGIKRWSDEQAALAGEVRRQPAWLEIGLVAVTLVAFVVTLVL